MTTPSRPVPPTAAFAANRLIDIDDLTDAEIYFLLDLADYYARYLERAHLPPNRLAGRTQCNFFLEPSTRTSLSFELAGQKLGANVINVPVAHSSIKKGESIFDTVQTLAAMGSDAIILRTSDADAHKRLSDKLRCVIVNAGAGAAGHPTQALLDAATIRTAFKSFDGLVVAICGDVKHSRVAASNAQLLTRLGAVVRFVAPPELMPDLQLFHRAERFTSLKKGLDGADIVMALRMQKERMSDQGDVAMRGYFEKFAMTHQTLQYARPNAKVMHPGPINRGVEIDSALADDPERSLILRQVFYGVAMRMACLDALITKGI